MLPEKQDGFDAFVGMFLATGKKLNIGDMIKAGNAWGALSPGERELAHESARHQLTRTKHAQFVPLPANFLRDQPWTRVGVERSLPYIDPKQDAVREKQKELRKTGLFSGGFA